MMPLEIRKVSVIRYITPLREGGSLPAVTDADDGFKYVVKFKGAGHGVKALVAELLGGAIAKKLGFKIPELVYAELDEAFGRTEGDEEIQDLLRASHGLNIGMHFLSGAINFDPVSVEVDRKLASEIVWLDAYITNIDRTFRNTNMLFWNREVWLIDNGASFYFHHSWNNWEKQAKTPFGYIKDHVLLPHADMLDETDLAFREILTDEVLKEIIGLIPDEWLDWEHTEETPEQIRQVYFNFLSTRLANSGIFLNEAKHAREAVI